MFFICCKILLDTFNIICLENKRRISVWRGDWDNLITRVKGESVTIHDLNIAYRILNTYFLLTWFKWVLVACHFMDLHYKIRKIHWRNKKNLLSRTTVPNSTKLGTKHPWVKGIQVYSNEEPLPFFKGRLLRNRKNILIKLNKSLLKNH